MSKKRSIAAGRSDAWDASLTEEQRWELYDKTLGMAWFAGAKFAAEEYRVKKPCRTAWYNWHDRMSRCLFDRKAQQVALACAQTKTFAKSCGESDEVKADALANIAMGLAVKTGDAKSVVALMTSVAELKQIELKKRDLALKAAAQKTKDEALKLAQDKFAAAEKRANDAKGVIADAKLTPAEREAKLKEIFGL